MNDPFGLEIVPGVVVSYIQTHGHYKGVAFGLVDSVESDKVTLLVKAGNSDAWYKELVEWEAKSAGQQEGKPKYYQTYSWSKRKITRTNTLVVLPHVTKEMLWEGRDY